MILSKLNHPNIIAVHDFDTEDGIDFFHMDALSSAVALHITCDLQLTLMASSLYRLLGARIGNGYEAAKSRHLFRDFIDATATIQVTARSLDNAATTPMTELNPRAIQKTRLIARREAAFYFHLAALSGTVKIGPRQCFFAHSM